MMVVQEISRLRQANRWMLFWSERLPSRERKIEKGREG